MPKSTEHLSGRTQQSVSACRRIREVATTAVVLCAIAQLLIEASIANAISVLIVAIASAITFQAIIRANIFLTAPLPALAVLGFNVATMSGALVVQTLDLRPLAFNLQVPATTFGACALFQGSLLIALFLFTSLPAFRFVSQTINLKLFYPMGLMRAPSPNQLWLMGIFGSLILAWSSTVMFSGEVEYGDAGTKFLFGLAYLAYAPFLIPLLHFTFPAANPARKIDWWLLLAYFVVLIVLAIARNSRGTFALGVANLGLVAFLLVLIGQLRIPRHFRRSLVAGAIVLLAAMPVLSDVAIAMVVVRAERGTISSMELVSRTFEAYQDKQALENYRQLSAILSDGRDYEEHYLTNPYLARFIQTKFFDNTLSLQRVINGQHSANVWDITLQKLAALLPTQLLRFMGSEVDKKDLEFSMGDALYAQQYGTGLGHYRTGSPVGHGLALMGPAMYIIAIPLFLITFIAFQSLTTLSAGIWVISPVILLQFMRIYFVACGDSLLDPITLMVRWLPQDIVIYWMVFHVTRHVPGFSERSFIAVDHAMQPSTRRS